MTQQSHTHVLHVFWFICWGIPAIVEDEDVRLWKTLIHFVEKVLFLEAKKLKDSLSSAEQ